MVSQHILVAVPHGILILGSHQLRDDPAGPRGSLPLGGLLVCSEGRMPKLLRPVHGVAESTSLTSRTRRRRPLILNRLST